MIKVASKFLPDDVTSHTVNNLHLRHEPPLFYLSTLNIPRRLDDAGYNVESGGWRVINIYITNAERARLCFFTDKHTYQTQ